MKANALNVLRSNLAVGLLAAENALKAMNTVIIGFNDAAPAFRLNLLGTLPEEQQLRTLLPPEERADQRPLTGFETQAAMRRELTRRMRSLRELSSASEQAGRHHESRRALALVIALKGSSGRGFGLANLANPVFMSAVRNAFISHLMLAIALEPAGTAAQCYTIIVTDWRRTFPELSRFSRNGILDGLRAHLNRAGLASLTGWSVVALHGEFRSETGSFDPHFHVLAVGEVCRAFEALHDIEMFKGGRGASIFRPVRGEALVNPPRQLSYLLQLFWPAKYPTDLPGLDGVRGRGRRMPEPEHAKWLLWFSRQSFSDIVWLQGIEIKAGRLKPKSAQ